MQNPALLGPKNILFPNQYTGRVSRLELWGSSNDVLFSLPNMTPLLMQGPQLGTSTVQAEPYENVSE